MVKFLDKCVQQNGLCNFRYKHHSGYSYCMEPITHELALYWPDDDTVSYHYLCEEHATNWKEYREHLVSMGVETWECKPYSHERVVYNEKEGE